MDIVMAHTWQRFKKSLGREQKRLEKVRKEVSSLWQGLMSHHFMPYLLANLLLTEITTDNATKRPSAANIRKYLAKSEALVSTLVLYGDTESAQELEDEKGKLGDMLTAMGLDCKGREKQRKLTA
jgi:hypothetical protein